MNYRFVLVGPEPLSDKAAREASSAIDIFGLDMVRGVFVCIDFCVVCLYAVVCVGIIVICSLSICP